MEILNLITEKLKEKNIEVNPKDLQDIIEANKIFILNDSELSKLKETVQKQSYDKAHAIGYKNGINDMAKEFDFEIDKTKPFDILKETFKENVSKKYTVEIENLKTELTKGKDEKIKSFEQKQSELQKSIENLQNQIKEKENLILNEKKSRYEFKAKSDFESELNKINISVPKEITLLGDYEINKYIEKQRQIAKAMFINDYNYQFDENGNYNVVDKQNNIVKDNLEKPLTLNQIVTNIASNYLTVSNNNTQGRGEGNKTKSDNSILHNFKDIDEFTSYVQSQGFNPTSQAALDIYMKSNLNKQ